MSIRIEIPQTPAGLRLERDRLCLVSVGIATSFATSADLDAERDRRPLLGVARDFPSASGEVATAVGETAGTARPF